MKRFLAGVLVLVLLLGSFTSCAKTENDNKKILLVASFYPIYIFTLNIVDGIDEIQVQCMAEQNIGCLHDYQLLSRDAKLISDADAFIVNGAGMEAFLEDVYRSVENLNVIDSSVNVELLENCDEHHEKHNHSGEHHDHNHSVNSHIWMSPENAKKQVSNIAEKLIELYPQYEEQINKNKADYILRIENLQTRLKESTKELQNKNIITFHESYDYLADEFSLNIVATVESHEGGEPSAKGLAELTEVIEKYNVSYLFVEPGYKGSAAEILKNETGVEICVLNPVLTGDGSLTSYEDIMEKNLKAVS